jgi:F0F1-type ATP synthase assembly protein I/cytoskeletal protein CcmA (bactofilin family)
MPSMIRRIAFVAVVLLASSWPAAASAQAEPQVAPRDQVVLSGDVTVARGTVVHEVVVFSGTATIAGVVEGDVVVVRGPVTVAGQVGGDVIALHGPIHLFATAQVGGDVRAGGALLAAPGAHVGGEIQRDVGFTLSGPVGVLGALLASAAVGVSILVAGLLVLLFAPRGADRASEAASTSFLASAGWGLIATIVVPVVALALAATILGLPLALALLLGLGLLWLIGLAATTYAIGRLLVRFPRSRVGAMFAGWAIGAVIGLVPFLNVVWWTLGAVFGIGAIIVAVWRVRSGRPGEPAPRADRGGRHRAVRRSPDAPVQLPDVVAAGEVPADAPASED